MGITELIVLALLKFGPGFARELITLFEKKEITRQDWETLFNKTPYSDYVGADMLAKAQALVAEGKGSTIVKPDSPPPTSPSA